MSAILFGSISTVVDTSELQRAAFNDAFAEHGLDWSWDVDEYRTLLTSNGGAARIADYAAEHGDEVDADAVHATKSQNFQRTLAGSDADPRPGVVDTVKAAKSAGWKLALVTTTSADNLDALFAATDGQLARSDFDVIVDRSDVAEGKPAPDAYEFALKELGEQPGDAVAVEDNVGGVAAARAAGVACVAFPNENTAGHDFGDAPQAEQLDFETLSGAAR